ncbi:hypothetical protein GN956_G25583, partial [Arapaima gigas]
CLTVRQTPAELIKNPEDNITLTCSHHDSSFDKMLWYQQVHGEGLRLLGLLSFKEVLEQQDGFSISGDAEKEAFLQITSARPQHTAVYMCAVSKAQCYRPLVSCAGTAAEPGRLLVTVHVKLDKAHFWGNRIHQSPPVLLKVLGDSAQLHCSHNIQNYNRMFWYSQSGSGGVLKCLGNLFYTDQVLEPGTDGRFEMRGDGRSSGSLSISNLSRSDNGTYFCAAGRHSAPRGIRLLAKTANLTSTHLDLSPSARREPPRTNTCTVMQIS